MKKFFLLAAASLMLGGAAFAQDTGSLGIGIQAESGKTFALKKNLRVAYFFDMGWNLVGPIHTGIELGGDFKQLQQVAKDFTDTEITLFGLGSGDYLAFIDSSQWKATTTLWDLDFSPRVNVSIDVLDKAQIMAYAGLNYNWQTIDYTIKNMDEFNGHDFGGKHYNAGEEKTNSVNIDQGDLSWNVVAGLRGTLDIYYIEYTRFLAANDTGDYSWSQFNKDRFSVGLNFRF